MRADTPGHGANLGFRHARHHRPRAVLERHGNAVEIFSGIAPEHTFARLLDQLLDGHGRLLQRLHTRGWNQPFVLLIQHRQRTGLADTETLEILELGVLRVGVIESYIQHGNDLAAAIAYGGVLRHVEAPEEQGTTNVALPTHYWGISRAGTVEHGADRPRPVLLGQRSAHADEIIATAYKHRRHPGGRLLELINFLEVVVQHFTAQSQGWSLHACHRDRLIRVHAQARAEAFIEQPAQSLRAFTQGAMEGIELVGHEARFAGQVFFTSREVGGVQRAQGKDGTAGDHDRQYHGEGEAQL